MTFPTIKKKPEVNTPTTVKIELDDESAYHIGGQSLTGNLIFTVDEEHIHLRDVKLRVVCDIKTSMEINTAKPAQKPKIRTQRESVRVYDGEMDLKLETNHLRAGEHTIPFRVPLPLDQPQLPPSTTNIITPSTYGHINFRLKVCARRSVTSWFKNGAMKAETPFLFMPCSIVSSKETEDPKLRIEPFHEFVSPVNLGKRGLMASLLQKKVKKEPPLEIQCTFSHPEEGLLQGSTTPLGLTVQTGSRETITLKHLLLNLETVLVLTSKKYSVEHIVNNEPIVRDSLLEKGASLDLSKRVKRIKVPSTLPPTTVTSVLSIQYRICIEIHLCRTNSTQDMKLTKRIPVAMLSPFLKVIDEKNGYADSKRADHASIPQHTKSSATFTDQKPNLQPTSMNGGMNDNMNGGASNGMNGSSSTSDPHPIPHEETVPSEAPPGYLDAIKD